ncbi:MAG: FAD:protein FMN transferase [Bacteroidales bacterium]|nr:FAD:protein FMN transferase [Bacteroidales bacterium]MBN2755749.1 FAD:protein FMN transferase [Bacteroidales bacterium]
MKKNLGLIVGILILLASCGNKYKKIEGFTQGTTYHITYNSSKDYSKEIDSLLFHFDSSLSTYKENSIISRVNKNDSTVVIDDLFEKFFTTSYEIYLQTYGYFDVTVGPLVNAWGFGFTEKADVDKKLIDSLLQYVGMEKIYISGQTVVKGNENIILDGNAIAQGQSVDYVSDFFDEKEIDNYLVEIGGELKAKGLNPDKELWKVGIDKPIENSDETNRELQIVLKLDNKSLATSGNYRKFYEKEGMKYSHTINPKTGFPVQHHLLSATIVADDCIKADAYATSCMVMGYVKAKNLIENLNEIEGYLIYTDEKGEYKVFASEGLKKMIVE